MKIFDQSNHLACTPQWLSGRVIPGSDMLTLCVFNQLVFCEIASGGY
jgi:hypothetical protein